MENNEIKDVAKSEEENVNEENIENTEEKCEHKNGFLNNLLAHVMDQIIVLACSALILLVFGFLIKFAGYMVVEPVYVLFIIYAIVNCIYMPVLKSSKLKKSFGEKIFNI